MSTFFEKYVSQSSLNKLNTGRMTELQMPIIIINSENEFISSINNISSNNNEWYRRCYSFRINISYLFGYGGCWYVEGVRTDPEYEWQIATSYGNPTPIRLMRSKYSGIWNNWVKI